MNLFDHTEYTPTLVRGDSLRVRLRDGTLYDVAMINVRRIEPMVSCCGGQPSAYVVLVNGEGRATSDAYGVVKALADAYEDQQRRARGNGPKQPPENVP